MQGLLLAIYGTVFVVLGVVAALWILRMTKTAFGHKESDENADE